MSNHKGEEFSFESNGDDPAKIKFLTVTELVRSFCREFLNEEYEVICCKAVEKLAEIEPSPLLRGKAEGWASGIIRAIGSINFLSDKSYPPFLKMSNIEEFFGVSVSNGQTRASQILELLKIKQSDFNWLLPSLVEELPMFWMLESGDGYILDVRTQPVELQREAYRLGLIPYVPADKKRAEEEACPIVPERCLFQFKVMLQGSNPPIWRRIQVMDCTMDKLHEHIQVAMGWKNCHLHEFYIDEQRCNHPDLLDSDFDEFDGMDSTKTLLSSCIKKRGEGFEFQYMYDFGDGWLHEVIFEGCWDEVPDGEVYPKCLDGNGACPPEDVGGIYGYYEYLTAIKDPKHEDHESFLEWGGKHDPDSFSAEYTTDLLQEGLPKP